MTLGIPDINQNNYSVFTSTTTTTNSTTSLSLTNDNTRISVWHVCHSADNNMYVYQGSNTAEVICDQRCINIDNSVHHCY